jgi:D-beta-D-heptose 7-phosphate kinase/D-beta-D-heptose 1-phosphate adenosyltransferase
MPLAASAAEALTRSFRDLKIVVVGDLMLDHFVWGSVTRISPEAPVPVVRVESESFHPGGAGNVACNLASLGARPVLMGVVGRDEAGRKLLETLEALEIPREGIVQAEGRPTTKKTRIVAHGQQVVRFDRETEELLSDDMANRILDAASTAIRGATGLIVSDYEKGTITASLLERLLPAADRRGLATVIDPKPSRYASYRPAAALTPNVGEASRMTGMPVRTDEEAAAAAEAIRRTLDCRAVLLTRGERGMLLCEKDRQPQAIPTMAREVFDVTGAGDTVAATFSLALAAGAGMADAAWLANAAAGVVVGKVGTATATVEEILAAL